MFRVRTATVDEHPAGVSLLLGHLPAAEREAQVAEILERARVGEVNLQGLLLSERDGEIVGAALMMASADAPVFVWPPAVRNDVPYDEPADALLQEVRRRIDAGDAWLGQCLLEVESTRERSALSRNGFAHLTDLLFLQRPLDEPLPPISDAPFETVAYAPGTNDEQFGRLLEATYVATRDCPELNGRRRGVEALAEHRASGRFDPSRWKIYRAGGEDVGVLLLSEHADQDAWEVVYMGVVSQARGRGYGRGMLLTGLYEARASGTGSVALAVDNRNSFAIGVYERLGFLEAAVRAVHVRFNDSRSRGQ